MTAVADDSKVRLAILDRTEELTTGWWLQVGRADGMPSRTVALALENRKTMWPGNVTRDDVIAALRRASDPDASIAANVLERTPLIRAATPEEISVIRGVVEIVETRGVVEIVETRLDTTAETAEPPPREVWIRSTIAGLIYTLPTWYP